MTPSRNLGASGRRVIRSGARHFDHRLHRQSELVLAEPKHQKLPLPAHPVDLRLRRECIADLAETFHDIPPKELFRREDRDQPSSFLAAIDRLDGSLASRARLNHRWHGIDQCQVGGDHGASAIGDETDKAAANGRDDDLCARFRNGGRREA